MHVVVVGAGPGGLFAAEKCAAAGYEVTVFDQRRSPARKLVLAGRGGLNITHSEDIEIFLDRYGPERSQLESAVGSFDPDDLRAWAAGLGETTFIGSSGRVFPESFRAVPMLRAWLRRLRALGVSFELGQRWLGWDGDVERQVMRFADGGGVERTVRYDVCVLALGGASWPRVGGDGSWVELLERVGVEVAPLTGANCGVEVGWSKVMVDGFAGSPIKNSALSVDGRVVRGDPVVTSSGLEGGPVYAHSRRIRELIAGHGSAEITIDLVPDLDEGDIVRRLVERRRKKRSTSTWLNRCGIDRVGVALMREATSNVLPDSADGLGALAKEVPIRVESVAPIDRAISSAGGVRWDSVDEHLELRSARGTYVVGEMLDWEAPTGGYLLQAVFSTANLAASAITARR